jgi:hypothetical protein
MLDFIGTYCHNDSFGFEYFAWIISHQKLPRLHFFKVKINNSFEIFI